MDIPINAEVQCTDGPGGRSIMILINPVTAQVTHLIVQQGALGTEHMVSLDLITESTPQLIRLRCTQEELSQFEPFSNRDYLLPEAREAWGDLGLEEGGVMYWPYAFPMEPIWTFPEHEHMPPGELAVRRGHRVEAVDGVVGQVDEFLVAPITSHISHLILREGHFWGPKDVTIPVSAISHIDDEVVHLTLDKATISALPAIPARR